MISIKPATREAYKLLHDGSLAFADAEATGMRVDMDYLDKTLDSTFKQIKQLESELRDDPLYAQMRRKYGSKTNLNANDQLGYVVFDRLGYKRHGHKNEQTNFEHVDEPFVHKFFERAHLVKAHGTYLKSIKREVVEHKPGYFRIHPFFHLHLVKTYRSSSSDFNFHNLPVRDDFIAKLIRSAFIADDDYVIVENDFGGIEVRVVACYNEDPVLIDYVSDSTKDMHRDMASLCYKLPKKEVSKTIRYCGKNMFVFPEFYGSYYIDCSRNLWEACERLKLKTEDNIKLRKHLTRQGFTELGDQGPSHNPRKGTFEHHIKQVEETLWKKFKVYDRWRHEWWRTYQRQGYIETLTGFILQEVYRRNQIINSPVQGSAFHILLMSFILLNKELKRRKMRSRLIGQIHDSIIAEVHKDELEEYLALVKHITTVVVPKLWKWICVPMEIEAEVAPLGGTWYDKQKVAI